MSRSAPGVHRMRNVALLALVGGVTLGAFIVYLATRSDGTVSAPGAHARENPARAVLPLTGEATAPPAPEREVAQSSRAPGLASSAAEAPEAAPAAEAEDWRALLDRIRSAGAAENPHREAWPHVRTLAERTRADEADGSPERIAQELDTLLRDPLAEGAFVRGAILLALGIAHPEDSARSLAGPFLDEPPGEVARAAWLVVGLTGGNGEGAGIDLGGFENYHSRTGLTIWPVTVPVARRDAAADLELALERLLPPKLYLPDGRPLGTGTAQVEQGVLTRETIVLALLAGGAREPGTVRDWLFEWAGGSDMSHACVWSLCLAARDDLDLALALRDLLFQLGLPDGSLLADLLSGMAGRGDLVFDMVAMELGLADEGQVVSYVRKVNALNVLGEIMKSRDAAAAARATDVVIDVALDGSRSEDLRFVTLVLLSVSNPARVGDAIEPILIGPESGKVREMAAKLADGVPVEQQQRMRDVLMNTYDPDASARIRETYVRSLLSLGGDDARAFLRGVVGSEGLSDEVRALLNDYLSP